MIAQLAFLVVSLHRLAVLAQAEVVPFIPKEWTPAATVGFIIAVAAGIILKQMNDAKEDRKAWMAMIEKQHEALQATVNKRDESDKQNAVLLAGLTQEVKVMAGEWRIFSQSIPGWPPPQTEKRPRGG